MIVKSIHLLAIVLLLGTGAALRLIIFPISNELSSEEATQFRGEAMLRARRVFWGSLIVSWVTGLYLMPWHKLGTLGTIHLKLALSIALTVITALIAISPHRRLWLKMRPYQRSLIDSLLMVGALTIWLSAYLTGL